MPSPMNMIAVLAASILYRVLGPVFNAIYPRFSALVVKGEEEELGSLPAPHRAAHVSRLGQDHAARLRARPRDGREARRPDKLCINVWGDAAIGFTGMDFETAVRERIPILSILFNNFTMAIELPVMPVSTEKYRSTDISRQLRRLRKASAATASASTNRPTSSRRSGAASRQPRKASPRCWSSSPKEVEASKF